MKKMMSAGAVALALMLPVIASAQSTGKSVQFPAGYAPGVAICVKQADGTCLAVGPSVALPTIGLQESFQLVAANAPSAAAATAGGDYILSQTCGAYGTLNLQVLGPDGATWQTVLAKTASDTAGGTGLTLGSAAQVRVTLTGTTGCNAILARVPT